MDAKGGGAKRLTFNEYTEAEPVVSADGRYIFFVGYKQGLGHIWRINADGTDQRQLTNGDVEDSPDSSPDNTWVVYHCEESSADNLCKIPVDGGTPTKLTVRQSIKPSISPDGKHVAYFSTDDQESSTWQLTITPLAGVGTTRAFDIPATVCIQCFGPRWTPDGQAVSYIDTRSGVSNIWIQALDETPPRPLTSFSESQIYAFAWSPDGKKLACVRGTTMRDVILVTNFR